MQKTICLVHGVGLPSANAHIKAFGRRLEIETGARTILAPWQHPGMFPTDLRSNKFWFGTMRDFTWEVIMDFAYVVADFDRHVAVLPAADMYVGHSAGGVLALAKANVPCVVMGTPVQLVKSVIDNTLLSTRRLSPILNILNNRDPIAAPLQGAQVSNMYFSDWKPAHLFNPIAAHSSYWTSDVVIKATAQWYLGHVKG